MALDSLVPGFADAAVVYVAERLLRDGDLASGNPGGQDGPGLTVRRVASRSASTDHGLAGFPPGQAFVLAAASPYAQCVHDGKPVLFARPDSRTPVQAGPGGKAAFSPYRSFLAVPMSAGSSTAGLIALARVPGRTAFGEDDITGIAHLAAITGTSIAKAVTLAWHQAITAALQRGLAGTEPVRPEHLDVAARCLPARGHLVGGDWYDIIALPAGRTGIVVGDVMGHGPEAAAIMAQLRAAAHVLAQQDLPPAELLGHLDGLIATLPGMPLATCAYAVIDPARQSCTFSAAGHLPPVLALPDGSTRTLDLSRRAVPRDRPGHLRPVQHRTPARRGHRPLYRRPRRNPHPLLRPRDHRPEDGTGRPGRLAAGHLRQSHPLARAPPRRQRHAHPPPYPASLPAGRCQVRCLRSLSGWPGSSGLRTKTTWRLLRPSRVSPRHSAHRCDYCLVMTGPPGQSRTRPWVIDSVFLFDNEELLGRLRARGVKIGVATSVRKAD